MLLGILSLTSRYIALQMVLKTDSIMLNRYHVNGLIMWPLFCSLDLAFGHCGKASKKMGTDLLAAFQLTHDLLFVFGILVIDLTKWCNFHLGTRKNWLKWKQSWLAYFSILLCCLWNAVQITYCWVVPDFRMLPLRVTKVNQTINLRSVHKWYVPSHLLTRFSSRTFLHA